MYNGEIAIEMFNIACYIIVAISIEYLNHFGLKDSTSSIDMELEHQGMESRRGNNNFKLPIFICHIVVLVCDSDSPEEG